MLIHQAHEEESGQAGKTDIQTLEENSNEFETADDIYQIMAKTNVFEGDGDKALTTSDLVLLYKNIDIDSKLVPNTDPEPNRSPNQYVETIIYNDDRSSEGTDVSEDISNEDFNHVCAINKERIDLLNNFGDKLCHKFGNIEMRTSDLTTDYERHFLFNDPYVKEQLKSFHAISNSKQSDSTILPVSLLDFICCKRLEDNYNFYMDNIIKYVQNTIEQLKRISNGDYLTEKAKAKWSEVNTGNDHISECKKIILAGSATIPLHVADKRNDKKITWDDIVHSEMDVRSLAKILEKKVIVEVPKIICGTYRLFSKRSKDNLIITCKKDPKKDSRVDVVLKLQRSKSGHVVSNINSIIILKPLPTLVGETENGSSNLLALEFEKVNTIDNIVDQNNKIIEIEENIKAPPNNTTDFSVTIDRETEAEKFSCYDYDFSPQCNCHEDNECDSFRAEADFTTLATDDLHGIIKRLSMQSPVVEEREETMKKKKSPLRVRIKSPYENKTSVMEEKKKKKLLEIRQRREAKKNEMSVNCKISKNKHEKSGVMAQASNSVTKLSITNKHFYNSIYGESINLNNKNSRKYHKDPPRVSVPCITLEDDETNLYKSSSPTPLTTPEKNGQKYINRSFYLDVADTEVMHLETKLNENQEVAKDDYTTSTEANDIVVNLNLLKKLMVASTTDLSLTDTSSSLPLQLLCENSFNDTEKDNIEKNVLMSTQSTQAAVFTKTQKKEVFTEYEENYNSTMTSVECRRSIDKIYELIKKISETDNLEGICSKNRIAKNNDKLDSSDSGSSIKHQLTSANSSCLNFEKANTDLKTLNDTKKTIEKQTPVITKVTVSSKPHSNKFINNTNNKENTKLSCCKNQENPLKAISQLIHEFDNVRKKINKNGNEFKRNKKNEGSADSKSYPRPNSLKRIPKQDQNLKESEAISLKNSILKDKRHGYGPIKISNQQFQHEEKSSNKPDIKKIADIIDEVKELRGEAVRGPPKKSTRLYSLAQPKKAYLSAQQEESQNRFGKRIPDRLSKPTIPIANPEIRLTSLRSKQRKVCDGLPASTKLIHTVGPALERSRNKALTYNSPSRDGNSKHSPVSVGRPRFNNNNINRTTELRNRKIEETKKNVKSHYGLVPTSLELGNSHNAHKSRVPLIPNDLDLVSTTSSPSGPEESTVLGKRLHNMIDAMVNSNMPTLEALTECKESINKSGDHLDYGSITGSKSDEVLLSLSDYPVDIFEDKNIDTAVSQIPKDNKEDEMIDRNSNNTLHVTRLSNSTIELPKLENELLGQISNGTFLKPLGINNSMFNITSKKSKQKLFSLNQIDTSSLVLKSKLSSNIDSLAELKILPVLSNNRMDFGYTKFPMQIATVGYVFPHIVKCDSMSKILSIKNEDSTLNSIQSEYVTHKALGQSIQCFRSVNKKKLKETSQIPNANKNLDFLDNHEVYATEAQNNNGKDVQENAVEDGTIEDITEADIKSSNISNSTSLDILVGLLNEIKKMTTYGSQLSKQETVSDFHHESTELEMILDKVSIKKSSVHHSVDNEISLPSLDNLQILKARASNLLHLPPTKCNKVSNRDITMADKKVTANTSLPYIPFSVDREVNAMILPTSYMHRFTEAPSLFNQLNVSTNVTDSLVKLINRPSRGSVYSFTDCENVSNLISKEMLEVPSKTLGKCIDSAVPPPVLEIQYLNPKENSPDIKTLAIYENNYSNVEFDSLLKMKRDILVTVYSILVLTVFAALSFPEIMYRVY